MDAKECPMCGTSMRLHTRERTERTPGARTPIVKHVSEWECPDCDYFEEAEES